MLKKLLYIIKKINLNRRKILYIEVTSIALLIINLLLSFAVTFLFAQMINDLFFNVENNKTYLSLLFFVIFTLINCIVRYVQYILMQKLGKEISFSLKSFLYNKILNKKIEFWQNYTVGELETILVNDINKLQYMFSNFYSNIIINVMTIIGISGILIYTLRFYGIIIIVLILTVIFIQRVFMKKIETLSNEVRDLSGKTAAIETESLMKSEDIYMTGYQEKFLNKFFENNELLFEKILKKNKLIEISSISTSLIQMINVIIILCTGAILIKSASLPMDTAISMYVFIQRLSNPINQMISQILNVLEIIPSINRIIQLIWNNENILWGTKLLDSEINCIEYSNVSFRYHSQEDFLFEHFNYTIKSSNKKVIIVGENGTGKSTMIKLLFNMCASIDGCIKINNIEINNLSEQTIRKHISYISQVPLVVSGTLKENLNIEEDCEMEKAELYLNMLGISRNWINEKKDLLITDKKNNFSGGELQKIAITRVLLENKDVILMDEPTSSLDEISVVNFLNLLDNYFSNKLIIIVTHDERVIKWGNHIIDLHKK